MIDVYVASKSCHAPMWRFWRETWQRELPDVRIVSSWIDVDDPTAIDWPCFVDEAGGCDLLIAVHHPGEEWRGALVEIGAALFGGADVVVIGDPHGSWKDHPRVRHVTTPGYDPGMALVDWAARQGVGFRLSGATSQARRIIRKETP